MEAADDGVVEPGPGPGPAPGQNRRAILAGAAGAFGLLMADSIAGAQSADATQGSAVLAGASNSATALTSVVSSAGSAIQGTASAAGTGVTGTGGATNGVGVHGTGKGSGAGVTGTGGPTSGTGVIGTGSGSNCVGVQGTGSGTGSGVLGIGINAGVGVKGQGSLFEPGVDAIGGTTSGAGVRATGGTPNGIGLFAIGTGTGDAIHASGGLNGGAGIIANAGPNSDGIHGSGGSGITTGVVGFAGTQNGTGVRGESFFLAVHGLGTGGATGVLGETPSGTAVLGSVSGTGATGIAVSGTHAGTGTVAQFQGNGPQLHLLSQSAGRTAPTADSVAHARGEVLADGIGNLWYCAVAGTPGTWQQLAGSNTAGSLHVLPAPVRVYDSRPGTKPTNGPKTPLVAGTARTLDLTVNSSGVPAGATAASVNLLLVNTTTGNGNFTIWANGVAQPSANNMVFGGTAGRFSSLALTALDPAAQCQVVSSVKTDFVLDVVGYYR